MNQFFLPFSIPLSTSKINHSNSFTFLGSCFSDEIGTVAELSGFDTLINPFGTIFNPISLGDQLLKSIGKSQEVAILERENRYYTWEASTKIVANSPEEIKKLIVHKREGLALQLSKPGFLIVTFGTAYLYRLNQGEVVANCHKQPGHFFHKELVTKEEILNLWKQVISNLQEWNPSLKIIFTVSPVRHVRDGIVENNRSKARLIDAVSELVNNPRVMYFPSYEIVLDVLRDYRFFKKDRIHPNEEAIQYVWDSFSSVYFSDETKSIVQQIMQIRKRLAHKSDQIMSLDEKTLQVLNGFKQNYPWIRW